MKKRCILLLLLCLFLSACNNAPSFTTFEGRILEIHEGYFLVEPLDTYSLAQDYDRIEVPMEHMGASPEPSVGDILDIAYDGQILEIYPPRIAQVHSIRVRENIED